MYLPPYNREKNTTTGLSPNGSEQLVMKAQTTTPSARKSTEKPSQKIVELIADLEGVQPTELTPPLYSVIDPDALDSLFHSSADDSGSEGHICFRYRGYLIRVQSNGDIEITNP